MNNEVAERYAQGLFELAEENGTVAEKKEQAAGLLKVLEESDDFMLFLRAVKVTGDEKKQMIETVFQETLDADMIRFLKLLVDKRRMINLREILMQYDRLANEKLGIETAVVSSARKLSDGDMERIQAALEKKTGKKIVLRNHVDESLIAGIKVTVGNNVTDVTVKSQIEDMRSALLKGGQQA